MLSPHVSKALNKQIEVEGFSSQYYLSMASWAETQGLNGVSSFLYHHADEERMHMLKLIKFVNERGGHGLVSSLKQPPVTYKSVKSVFEEILKQRPDHIDSLYGLGLSRRANGETAWAIEAFKKALVLATEALNAEDKNGAFKGNNLESYDDDRYMMLTRMIKQRLVELDS